MNRNNLSPNRNYVEETAIIAAVSFPEEIKKLTVTNLCKRLRVSRNKLDKQFQTELGISVKEFLLRQRVIKAGFFIEDDLSKVYSVKEIAALFGFRSSRDFSRTFEQFMATTPENFRRYKQIVKMKNEPTKKHPILESTAGKKNGSRQDQ